MSTTLCPAAKLAQEKARRPVRRRTRPRRGPVVCRLAELLKKYSLTLVDVAPKVDVSVSGLCKIVSGKTSPNVDLAQRIANFFGVPVGYVWPGTRRPVETGEK
jgi:DNA-binding XRE family transcriptional regulator